MQSNAAILLACAALSAGFDAHAVPQESRQTLSSDKFFSDTHLDLGLRNYWKYLKEDESQEKYVHNAWGQAISLNLRSGYLWDVLGFDATYTRAIRLGASDYFSTRAILYNSGSDMKKDNAHGFSKFDQRYVKVKLGDESLGLTGKAGWHHLKNFGVLTTSNRLSENSYLGYSGTLSLNAFSLDSAFVTHSINRDSPQQVHLLTNDKKNFDSIFTVGANWREEDKFISYAVGEAKDYLQRHVIELSYDFLPQWKLSSQIYGSYALENYKSMPAGKKEFDEKAWHYAGEIQWKNKDWRIKSGVAWTEAHKKNAVGYYDRQMGKNMRGRFNALTAAGKDYMRDGELALTLLTEYQLMPELISGVQINYGQFNYKRNQVRTGEVTVLSRWKPREGALKNLTVMAMGGYGWSYQNSKETPLLTADGKYRRSPSLSGELIIDYKFGIF